MRQSPLAPDMAALLDFLDRFDTPGYSHGRWVASGAADSTFDFSPVSRQFVEQLATLAATAAREAPPGGASGMFLYTNAGALERARLPALRHLLVLHAWKDRSVPGHLAGVMENGHVTRVLRRVRSLTAGGADG